jgi:hypothetical protein
MSWPTSRSTLFPLFYYKHFAYVFYSTVFPLKDRRLLWLAWKTEASPGIRGRVHYYYWVTVMGLGWTVSGLRSINVV